MIHYSEVERPECLQREEQGLGGRSESRRVRGKGEGRRTAPLQALLPHSSLRQLNQAVREHEWGIGVGKPLTHKYAKAATPADLMPSRV